MVKLSKKTATKITTEANGTIRVRYHSTDVVSVYPNGSILLDNGGWFSNTTKSRMNQASKEFNLGFSVWQKNFEWFVDFNGKTHKFTERQLTLRPEAR